MHVTIRRYTGVTGSADEIRRRGQDAVGMFQQMQGFVGWYLIDAGGGAWASVSVFEDRAAAEASTARAAEFIRENLADLFPNPPEVTTGEVVLHGT